MTYFTKKKPLLASAFPEIVKVRVFAHGGVHIMNSKRDSGRGRCMCSGAQPNIKIAESRSDARRLTLCRRIVPLISKRSVKCCPFVQAAAAAQPVIVRHLYIWGVAPMQVCCLKHR